VSDSNVIKFTQPGAFTDSLTEILRNGARALLTQAVEAEVAEFLAKHADLKTETGQQRVLRHGHPSGTRYHDRHRAGRRSPAAGARPRSERGRTHPVLVIDRAAGRAAIEEP
jgi:hypothetical protein